jgi:hypothetical protein
MLRFLVVVLAVLMSMVGCGQTESDGPQVKFNLDKDSITVQDDKLSEEFITATITRQDIGAFDAVFQLQFPDELESAYAATPDGNRQLSLQTRRLRGKNAQDTVQFKVWGTKGEALEARYQLTVELWWNGSWLAGQDKKLEVKVI